LKFVDVDELKEYWSAPRVLSPQNTRKISETMLRFCQGNGQWATQDLAGPAELNQESQDLMIGLLAGKFLEYSVIY
jgi:hypothetical protein